MSCNNTECIDKLEEKNNQILNLKNDKIKLQDEVNSLQDQKIKLLDKKIELLEKNKDLLNNSTSLLNNSKEIFNKIDEKLKKNQPKLDIHLHNSNWIEDEINKKPEDYINLNICDISKNLKKIFSKIKTINDIINLQNEKNKYDYFNNKKFKNLYKLIPSLQELNNMIGMDNIKKDIYDTICYFIHGLNNDDDLNNIVITGDPGVGKSSLAKIIGNIYLSLGLLQSNKFILAKRSNLIAEYTGQTAIKTQKVIDEAEGGVLFIDEVYSLGNDENKDSFAKECIDTINQNLTEKCDKFLCIIAGYKEDVNKCFFNYNQGLERRFTKKYDIKKYSSKDLTKMLLKFIKDDKWNIDFNPENLISKNLKVLEYQCGDIKILLKNAKQEYSIRLMNSCIDIENNERFLNKKDFNSSIKKLIEQRKKD